MRGRESTFFQIESTYVVNHTSAATSKVKKNICICKDIITDESGHTIVSHIDTTYVRENKTKAWQ